MRCEILYEVDRPGVPLWCRTHHEDFQIRQETGGMAVHPWYYCQKGNTAFIGPGARRWPLRQAVIPLLGRFQALADGHWRSWHLSWERMARYHWRPTWESRSYASGGHLAWGWWLKFCWLVQATR